MRRNRFTSALLLSAAAIWLAGLAAPTSPWINTGVPEEAFWISKAFHAWTCDMILAGDSRVLKGISPAAMEKVMPSTRIYNFGFDHNAYTKKYLLALEALVDRTSPHKSILLGISPQSLTLEAARRNGFLALRKNDRFERFEKRCLEPYLSFFKPYNLYLFVDWLRRVPVAKYYQHHYSDGWVASYKEPEDPLYQVRLYRGRFANNRVSPEMTHQLLDFVHRWRQSGIVVFGLRLPTSPAMLALENRQSGFDQAQFVHAFKAAGGIWLYFNQTGYHSYDGSHLRRDAAIRLSTELARRIRSLMNKQAEDVQIARTSFGPVIKQ
jgi:hypothetical protein